MNRIGRDYTPVSEMIIIDADYSNIIYLKEFIFIKKVKRLNTDYIINIYWEVLKN